MARPPDGDGLRQDLERCVIGVDLGGTNLRLALADGAGRILARWTRSTVGLREPRRIVEYIAEGTEEMLRVAGVPRVALRAIGVGAPGITDAERGVVLQTSYLLGWTAVPLVALLEARLGIPAAVDNDVNVALLGEASAGVARGERDFVMVAIGTGIGAGIQVGGAVLRGRNWLAGEIGYMVVPGVSEEPAGEGEPGALESVAGGRGIQMRWRELAREHPGLVADSTATQVFDLAVGGEPHAAKLLDHVSRVLAAALYNVCLVVDVPLLVLSGSVGVHPALRAAVDERLGLQHWRERPRVLVSSLGTDAQLIGALSMARRRIELVA